MAQSTGSNHRISQEDVDHESTFKGSVFGPYREPVKNHFAACNFVSSPLGSVESYARSLLSTGNGYPVFKELLLSARSPAQHYRAPGIGDVGFLDSDGDFAYVFNIFKSADDPINLRSVPPGFVPMVSPQSSEITLVPNFFSPGTIIASKGIYIHRVQESPLEFTASTCAREGGILVLPDGATREDLAVSAEVLEYIQANAIAWYQYICVEFNAATHTIPNGSLYVITGSDKAQSFSAMTIPGTVGTPGMDVELRYKHDNPKVPWFGRYGGDTSTIKPEQRPGGLYSVFVRGLRVSLNHPVWMRRVARRTIEDAYCNILTTPIVGFRSRLVRRAELRSRTTSRGRTGDKMPFHPSEIIAQMIFEDWPNSQVAIVDDAVWISHVDSVQGDATLPDIVRLVASVFLSHTVKSEKNVVEMLHSKDTQMAESSALRCILAQIYDWPARWKLERRVNRLLRESAREGATTE